MVITNKTNILSKILFRENTFDLKNLLYNRTQNDLILHVILKHMTKKVEADNYNTMIKKEVDEEQEIKQRFKIDEFKR